MRVLVDGSSVQLIEVTNTNIKFIVPSKQYYDSYSVYLYIDDSHNFYCGYPYISPN